MANVREDTARYTCQIVFHRAHNVPIADINKLSPSSDPYLVATLSTKTDASNPQSISFRTNTVRRSLNPEWNAPWIVSGVPAAGFILTLSLHDEDPYKHDDHLGKAVVSFPECVGGPTLKEGWDTGEHEFKVHKRHGSVRTEVTTFTAKLLRPRHVNHRARILVSVRVLGSAHDGKEYQKLHTVGPHVFVRHYSPLATALSPSHVSAFIANRLQLTGPVPSALRHRYVGFALFVKAMFKKRGIEGLLLNRALKKQHRAIYKWDSRTEWGIIGLDGGNGANTEANDEGARGKTQSGTETKDTQSVDGPHATNGDARGEPKPETERGNAQAKENEEDRFQSPNKRRLSWREPAEGEKDEAFARKFLDMVKYGSDGRIFTYVIMLDGEWRFTETGEEFTIQFLSKHTMHADVAREIAFSGEFFVRRAHHDHAEPDGDLEGASTHDPSAYELVIDNDSGTYRPAKDLLPVLEEWLSTPANLGALGRVRAMDGFDETLKRWKDGRKEKAGKGRGVARQMSVSSSSSSSSSSSEGEIGQHEWEAQGEENGRAEAQIREAEQTDADRARDNGDDDDDAKKEQNTAARHGEDDKKNAT